MPESNVDALPASAAAPIAIVDSFPVASPRPSAAAPAANGLAALRILPSVDTDAVDPPAPPADGLPEPPNGLRFPKKLPKPPSRLFAPKKLPRPPPPPLVCATPRVVRYTTCAATFMVPTWPGPPPIPPPAPPPIAPGHQPGVPPGPITPPIFPVIVPQIPPDVPPADFLPLNKSDKACNCEPINCSNIFFTGPSAMFSTSLSSAWRSSASFRRSDLRTDRPLRLHIFYRHRSAFCFGPARASARHRYILAEK